MSKTTPTTKTLQAQIESAFTTAPVTVPETTLPDNRAEFLRLPRTGQRDAIFALSRSHWNQLILPCKANNFRPRIKSICVRKPGAIRGVRLISIASARAFFAKLLEEQESEVVDPGAEATTGGHNE